MISAVAILVVGASIWAFTGAGDSELPKRVDFNYHIRPILSNNCYTCHGPDSSSREAGLRLDTYEGATAVLESSLQAIKAGSPKNSELIRRISHANPEERMPPPDKGKALSQREVALLSQWIRQGAEFKKHWSLISPEKPKVPRISRSYPQGNEIDPFLYRKIDEQELTLAPKAEKAKLLRRLSFVLTGLPPKPADILSFQQDSSEHAYEKWVDYYLNSPHYGERWARHWMDLVRYAESRGHEFDYTVGGAWRYRDYLIRAFNQDVPYTQLVQEHLAGDVLENPRINPQTGTNESLLGTMYFRMGDGKHSPVDIKEEEAYLIDNNIDVTSKAFQGLTVGCARCHDHKFDPILAKDYYAMYGMLESTRNMVLPATYTQETAVQAGKLKALRKLLQKEVVNSWQESLHQDEAKSVSTTDKPEKALVEIPDSCNNFTIYGDFRNGETGSWRSHGLAFSGKDLPIHIQWNHDSTKIQELRYGMVSSRGLAPGLMGNFQSQDFIIEHDTLEIKAAGIKSRIRLVMENFQLIQYPIYGGLSITLDDPQPRVYGMDVSMWKGYKAYFEVLPGEFQAHVYDIAPNAYAEIYYAAGFACKTPFEPPLDRAKTGDIQLARALNSLEKGNPPSTSVSAINTALKKGLLSSKPNPEALKLLHEIDSLSREIHSSEYIEVVQPGEYRESPVFLRGSHKMLDSVPVPHAFLSAVVPDSQVFDPQISSRLQWAHSLFDPHNPLTARVWVNRLWHHVFGRGLVETVDNFGVQGKLPSHPELLDYLAIAARDSGWSTKKMLKMMCMTAAFQRDTRPPSLNSEKDPQNIWLAHYPIRRVEAEAIRDALLASSGCLDSTLYGPSVPVHLTAFMNGRGRPRMQGALNGEERRSIYTAIRRNFLPALMQTFDMPVPASTFGKRDVTNIPGQSLSLMNDPLVHELAFDWATNLCNRYPGSWEMRLYTVYLTAFSRPPTQQEVAEARTFLLEQGTQYNLCEEDGLHEVRCWKDLCHAIFNTKAFIYLL